MIASHVIIRKKTIDFRWYRLLALLRFLEVAYPDITPLETTRQIIREFICYELQHNSATTANHSLGTVKVFFSYLVAEGYLSVNPTDGMREVKAKQALIEIFTNEQIRDIFNACGNSSIGKRDRAIFAIILDCGLRASELCDLVLDDVRWNDNMLKVIGKGRKERMVHFGSTVRQTLRQYLMVRGELHTDALFVTRYGDPIDRFGVRDVVRARCKQACITGVRCSPHTFRHTFAVNYLRNGGDVFTLQKMLGHADLRMTRRYCELSDTDVAERHKVASPADRLELSLHKSGRRRIM